MNQRTDRFLFWIRLLAVAAVVVSCVLLYEYVRLAAGLSGKSFCNISQTINCDAVSQSKWARILGFPLAGYGLGFYLAVFFLALLSASGRFLERRSAGNVLLLLSIFSVVFSLYLFFISAFAVQSFCILCACLYVINILFFLCALGLEGDGGLFVRMAQGRRALWRFAALCSGSAGEGGDRLLARAGLAALLILSCLVFSLPDMILVKLVLPALHSEQNHRMSGVVLESWNASPKVEVSFQAGGLERDYARGPESAPITVVEFSDFECPACRAFYEQLEELLQKYEGKVRLIFRNFPLDDDCNPLIDRKFHLSACYAALFARCAGEQGRFWEALDFLFRLPELEDGSPAEARRAIDAGARVLALDGTALDECMKSRRHAGKLEKDAREAEKLGLEGTPSVWVNGKKVEAANTLVLDSIFRAILSPGTPPG